MSWISVHYGSIPSAAYRRRRFELTTLDELDGDRYETLLKWFFHHKAEPAALLMVSGFRGSVAKVKLTSSPAFFLAFQDDGDGVALFCRLRPTNQPTPTPIREAGRQNGLLKQNRT